MVFEKAYAKLNLFLDVEGKRPNGYHDLVSVMQTVDWFDEIYIDKSVSSETVILTNSDNIPNGKDNIAYRAATKYLDAISERVGVTIDIRKNIPVAAGMAGGSADAAAVLRGMNRLFGNKLSLDALLEIGASIGADVPFCLVGGTKMVRGIGEEMIFCESDFPDCTILCAKLGEGIFTQEAYRLLDERYNDFQERTPRNQMLSVLLEGMKKQSVGEAAKGFFNVFEDVIQELRPCVLEAKQIMIKHGALVAMMSGSGPSVFGIFEKVDEANKALLMLLSKGAAAKVCRPIAFD